MVEPRPRKMTSNVLSRKLFRSPGSGSKVLSKKQDLVARYLILVAIGVSVGSAGIAILGIPLTILGWTFLVSFIVLYAGLILWKFRNVFWFYEEPDQVESLTPV